MRYKNIIFDMGGVILDIDYHRTVSAFEKLGIGDFENYYSQSGANDLFMELEKGNISADEFYKGLNEHAGENFSEEEIRDAWNAILLDFRESSLSYLETLKPKTNLLLLSNTNAIHVDELHKIYNRKVRRHPFEDYFHHCIYSFDTGTRKPDADCFEWTLDHAGIRAEDSLFIDDTAENTAAAENLGIKTITLKKGTMIEDLGLDQLIA